MLEGFADIKVERRPRGLQDQAGRADAGFVAALRPFVCLIEARLHFGESHDLKGKRKQLKSLKERLRSASALRVAETEGHDTWQRTTLLSRSWATPRWATAPTRSSASSSRAARTAASFDRTLRSLEDIRD